MLALRTGAPVCPVGQVGYRDIPANLKRLRRTPVSMKVGRLFIVRSPETRTGSAGALRQIADEMMYQIALLLPPESRGVYADLDKLTTDFLDFDVPPPPAD
jgi:1-acyl-sn-glycerol-3-phosphate acyltransferase